MTVAVRVRITGRVQGVGFRGWVVREANRRDLSGWVRNRLDGSVEALFAGDESAVMDMVMACHDGPAWSRVAGVSHERAEPPDDVRFQVLRD